jgi:hypothetical protein
MNSLHIRGRWKLLNYFYFCFIHLYTRSDTKCPSTIPSRTIKWHFSQFRTKCFSSHLRKSLSKYSKQLVKDFPYIVKSSMNTSMIFSIMLEKIDIMHC